MKKTIKCMVVSLFMLLTLSGCNTIGNKTTSMSIIYGVTAVLSLMLLIGYCTMVRKREVWFLLLFSSVLVVNVGYFTLAISGTLEEALLANRIAYLGSVFLPMAMLMILLNTTKLSYRKWLPLILLAVSVVVFFIAASPGYLDIYYKAVSLQHINGVTVLQKEYGSWHCVYLFYLMFYFATMIAVIVRAAAKKKLESNVHVAVLMIAVCVNIGVWLLEQLVQIDFEFLSVSYIISELFLLGLYMMIQENEKRLAFALQQVEQETCSTYVQMDVLRSECEESASAEDEEQQGVSPTLQERCERFAAGLPELTQTERAIYQFYLDGKSTKEIMQARGIKENTLKYHNKNLYSKLGVSSRKQLIEIAGMLSLSEQLECGATADMN